MKYVIMLAAVALASGCESCAKSLTEKGIEAATGAKNVDIGSDGKVVIQTDKGTVNIDGTNGGGNVTITGTDANGTGTMKITGPGDSKGTLTFSGTGKNGEQVQASFGPGGKVPTGFPLPVVDDLKVVQSAVSEKEGKKTYVLTGTTSKSVKDVAAFYEPHVKKVSAKAATNHIEVNGAQSTTLSASEGGKKLNVMVMQQPGQPTTVTVSCEGC